MEGWDAVSWEYPLLKGVYNRRRYLTSYGKEQKAEFGTIYIDRNGVPDEYEGNVIITDEMASLGDDQASAEYRFEIREAGYYDIAVQLCFPYWDKNAIIVSLDGESKTFSENRLWWPYWRRVCWLTLAKGVFLQEGTHAVSISGGVPGVQFYGFRVCSGFSEYPFAGEASFMLSPRRFKDVNGVMVEPDRGFKLTFEMLRRKPDSALIWYEDFRDRNILPENYWTVLDGEWDVWQDPESTESRPYSSSRDMANLHGNTTGFPIFISGQGWPSLKIAVDGLGCSLGIFSAA